MATGLRTAPLLALDPELGRGLTPAEHARAIRETLVPVVDLDRGAWTPATYAGLGGRPYALLIIEGLIVRDIVIGDVVTSELLGPRDLVEISTSVHDLVPMRTSWSVTDTACLAVLDLRTRMFMHHWPALGTALLERTVRHAARNGTHRAINQLPRVEDRLLAMFGYMAERWGRVSGSGILIPVALTHEALGRLVGARRPTVSLAMRDLTSSGCIGRRADGSWILRFDATAALDDENASPRLTGQADVRPVEPIRAPVIARTPLHVTPADRAALRARLARLRDAHERRTQRTAEAIARSVSIRDAAMAARDRRSA